MNKSSGDVMDIRLIRRIMRLAGPYPAVYWSSILLTLVIAAMSPVRPWLIQRTVDQDISKGDLDGLYTMVGIIFTLLFLETAVKFFHTYQTNALGQLVIRDLRVRVFRHISRLKLKYIDRSQVGTLVTRSVNDIETVSEIFSQGLIIIAGDLLQLIFILGVMLFTDWKLTLISLSVMPLLVVASNIFRKGIKHSFQKVRSAVAKLNAFVQERISGMRVVQMFNREAEELEKFKAINKAHLEANKESIFHYAVFFPVVEIITASSIGLLVWWGSKGALTGGFSPGVIISFILYINMFFRPIRMIADRFNTMQMGMVASERIFELLDDEQWLEREGGEVHKVQGEVEFDKVWFAYNDEEYVLKNISFKLKKGQTLAIVGETGAGKSSIINLISRFYEIQKGDIRLDGISLNQFDLHALREQIAVVLQDVFLFSGSVRDNIRLSNEVSEEKMREAIQSIGAGPLLESLPQGYDYKVMERGNSLSVGQRQMISFARALAFDPAILILDEATSSVDSETEKLLQEAVEKLLQGRTSIVIAHRLSTVRHADQILVMRKGEIVERGTHETLAHNEGYYSELLQKQTALLS